MRMKSLAIAVFTVIALAFGTMSPASASVEDFGIRNVTATGFDSFGFFQSHTLAESQPFNDIYNFGVNDIAAITFDFQVNNSQGRLIDVVSASPGVFTAQLYADAVPIGSGVFATQDAPNGKTFSLAFANLQVGVIYSLNVIGNVLAPAGGTYTFSANVSQVPLPAAAWLLLSALMGLASVAGIRRKRVQTA